jgi:hypothetical protein
MRQLIISSDLLAHVRAAKKPFGTLQCTQFGSVALARNLSSSAGEPIPNQIYSELVIEEQGAADRYDARLPFIIAEQPLEDDPVLLKPKLPLGAKRAEQEGPAIEQPYFKTLLEDKEAFLAVGAEDAQLLYAQAWPAADSRVWRRGVVTETPPQSTNDGLDPNIQGTRVGIVGLGSIGGALATLLSKAGVKEFVFVDPDRLERKNLRRHVCGPRHIGIPKVDAVADHLLESGFDVSATRFAQSIPRDDRPEIRQTLKRCHVLVCCADSSAAQHHVNYLAAQLGLPSVIASIKLLPEALGEVVVTKAGQRGCLNCWRLQLERRKIMMRGDANDPRDYPGPTAATPVGIPGYHLDQVAAVACDMVSRAIVDTEPSVWLCPLQTKVSGFDDLEVQAAEVSAIEPDAKCLVCGSE